MVMSNFNPILLSFLGRTNAMEAAIRFSSWCTFLLHGIIYLLLLNGACSINSTFFPEDFADQPCDLASGKTGVCVYGYLCRDSIVNIDGNGIIDLRFLDACEDYFLKCCSKETPCLENAGTCVSNNDCGADLNDPKHKKFKQTDECDWSDNKCCPNDKIGKSDDTTKSEKENCNTDSLCVPSEQCKVNPDGDGLLEARSAVCSSLGHTCCPESMIKGAEKDNVPVTVSSEVHNSIEQYETCDDNTVCVFDHQCLVNPDGSSIIQERVSNCSGRNQTCCPRDKVKGDDPCDESGGTCIREDLCPASSSLKMDLRISQCEESGFVCCMQDAQDGRDQFIGKICSGGKGKCTPKKQCRGTTYRDRNNDCGGLACCATISTTSPRPNVSTSTTRKPVDNENDGKACSNNRGKCTSGSCDGIRYRSRNNECGGLICCAPSDLPVSVITTTTRKPAGLGNEGKACNFKSGVCMTETCLGDQYKDTNNDCGGLNCCAEIEFEPDTEAPVSPVRSCQSVGGKCMVNENCRHKADFPVEDCGYNEVCCIGDAQRGDGGSKPDEQIKDCGYRNENGVKFETTGREDGESQFGEFPWMVAIMVNEKGKHRYACGGSLIDPEVVLTSAECVKTFKRTPDMLTVRAGEWDMGTDREPIRSEERRVTKIKSHPNFKATTLVNNIALLFLDDKFDQSSTINTVCLPHQNYTIDNGEVTASGWGSTPQDRTKYQQILKSIDLQFVDRSDCEQILRKATRNRNFKLHRSFMCAGGAPGLDTCKGDTGSPIVFPVPNDFESRYYAVGMVSWGVGCGKPGMPAAYTDIGFFRDWIDNEIESEGLNSNYYTYTQYEDDNKDK